MTDLIWIIVVIGGFSIIKLALAVDKQSKLINDFEQRIYELEEKVGISDSDLDQEDEFWFLEDEKSE